MNYLTSLRRTVDSKMMPTSVVCFLLLAVGAHALTNQDGNADCHVATAETNEPCENPLNDEPNKSKIKRDATAENIIENETKEGDLVTEFLCREATRTIVHWRSKKNEIMGVDEWNRYVLKVYTVDQETKLLNSYEEIKSEPGVPYVKVLELKPNTTYKFGIRLKTRKDAEPIEILTTDTFTTLPEDIRNLSSVTFSEVSHLVSMAGKEVRTNFTWVPVAENVCSYEILIINQNASFGEHPRHFFSNAEDFYTIEIPHLCYGCRISIAVYPANPIAEGKKTWITFDSPRCVDFHNWDYSICAPVEPENVQVTVEDCQLDVKWNRMEHPPPEYEITVTPSNPIRYNSAINDVISGQFPEYRAFTQYLGEYMTVKVQARSPAGLSQPWSTGVENHCTPQEAAVEPVGPPVIIHKEDLDKFTSTTEKPSKQTHTGLASHYMLVIIFFILFMLVLVVFLGYRAYYNIHKTERDPLAGRQDLEMREPLASKDKSDEEDAARSGAPKPSTATDDADAGEFEVRRENLQLQEVVGEGEFGVVRRAYLRSRKDDNNERREVAVKMLRDNASAEDKRQLKLESEVMKSVGTHKNIVCLVGFCSSSHMLVVEYCSLGDLQNFLRNIWRNQSWAKAVYQKNNPARNSESENVVSNLLYNKTEVERKQLNVTVFDLISLSYQVALGMEYLSKNKVVHRDLAARNILLDSAFTAKISDFGLSRDVYEENMYRHKGVHRLPIKWMAIECLVHQMFTTQSDVWSFGILLWEIMTLGGCPYPSLQSAQVFKYLQQRERLERPKLCPKNLYDMMYECWNEIPHHRPTFTQIVLRLEAIMQIDEQHKYLQLNEVIDSYSPLYVVAQEDEADWPPALSKSSNDRATTYE